MKRSRDAGIFWAPVIVLVLLELLLGVGCGQPPVHNSPQHQSSPLAWELLGGNAGINGLGGAGGDVYLTTFVGGGDLVIKSEADPEPFPALVMPGAPQANFGSNPWLVVQDYTVNVYPDKPTADTQAPDNSYLLLLGDSNLYHKVVPGQYEVVTGLQMGSLYTTLTFGLNFDRGGNNGQDTAVVTFAADVSSRGTITTKPLTTGTLGGGVIEDVAGAPATDLDRGGLELRADNLVGFGKLDLSGGDCVSACTRGGFGGRLEVVGKSGVFLSGESFVCGGMVAATLSGQGGNAGSISISSELGPVAYGGMLHASGGQGSSGGAGGQIVMRSLASDVLIEKAIYAEGGAPFNGNGGNAGSVAFEAVNGAVKNYGEIAAYGSDSHRAGAAGPLVAGNGGGITFTGQNIYNHSIITANGGSSASNGQGGVGGGLLLKGPAAGPGGINFRGRFFGQGGNSAGGDPGGGGGSVTASCPQGQIKFTGAITISSGNGEAMPAPPAGVDFSANSITISDVRDGIHLDGGEGQSGGPGGSLNITAGSGLAQITVPLTSTGGDAKILAGGAAGSMSINNINGSIYFRGRDALVGGNGAGNDGWSGPGGNGAGLILSAVNGTIDFSAEVAAGGGDAGGSDPFNGGAGGSLMLSAVMITAGGTADLAGGKAMGTGVGGRGGTVTLLASIHATAQMDLSVPGGAGDATVGVGGDGGGIDLNSTTPPTTVLRLAYHAEGGAAQTNGAPGLVRLDGVTLWP
jgi:hypothetical protein